jgi:hypothetical protein
MRDSHYSNLRQPGEADWKAIEQERAQREQWPLPELFLDAPSPMIVKSDHSCEFPDLP